MSCQHKRSDAGGNSANVSWVDDGRAPAVEAYTSSGKQDNAWHVLRETDYTRGYGDARARFVFDKSFASDPSCSFSVS